MKVRFADDVLAEPSAWHDLDRIIDQVLAERHAWDVADPVAVENSAWLTSENSRATRRNLEALQKVAVDTLYTPAITQPDAPRSYAHTLTIVVSMTDEPPATLAPADARNALEKPVYVVVENADSDKAFLYAMIRAFDRDELREALDKGWIEVVSAGGGGEIPKRVHDLVVKAGKGPRRILILSDSDRMVPGEHTKTIEKMQACRQEHEVSVVILHKREIENYLPVGALQRVSRKRKAVYNAFLQLTQEQRDHYDMKQGFKKDEKLGKVVVPSAQAVLFDAVRPSVLERLCGGFGKEAWRFFENAADVIDAHAVRQTCPTAPDELENLLDDIARLI